MGIKKDLYKINKDLPHLVNQGKKTHRQMAKRSIKPFVSFNVGCICFTEYHLSTSVVYEGNNLQ